MQAMGRPGTWEVSPSPPETRRCGRAAIQVRPGLGGHARPRGSEQGEPVVPPSEGDEARRDGRREVGVRW